MLIVNKAEKSEKELTPIGGERNGQAPSALSVSHPESVFLASGCMGIFSHVSNAVRKGPWLVLR